MIGTTYADDTAWADRDRQATDEHPATAIDDRFPVLNWHKVWRQAPDEVDWLVKPIMERGRLYSLYSPPKVGKSLLALEIAAALAAGRSVLGNPARERTRVLYVDMENTPGDLVERLAAYGYEPGALEGLRYLSFPNFRALDSQIGGQDLIAVAEHHDAEMVVIDTVARVVAGKENDSDTFHALYRYALAPLKGRGVTVLRLDHTGKDEDRGQRGSSAKSSDVDVVWKLSAAGKVTFTLTRVAARNTHSPEEVRLIRRFAPLRHEITEQVGADAAVVDAADRLTRLGVPLDHGRDKCRRALGAARYQCSNEVLTAAIKYRKSMVDCV